MVRPTGSGQRTILIGGRLAKLSEKFMDEQEFDSIFLARPFGTAEATRAVARLRRCGTLGLALWGRTSDDLRRQLLAPYPEIPSGFDLENFRELQQFAQLITSGLASSRNVGLPPFPLATSSPAFFVGAQRFTPWEGCCEILRRAIEHLEKR
jgi:hypothetical protein